MTTISTDESLMAAVREGTSEELASLFDRHHQALYEFFFRMSNDRAASENLVQDVFYRILKYRDTFRDDDRFISWLYRIARNAHHDMFRKTAVAEACEDDPELMRKVSPSAAEGSRKDRSSILRCALLKMPEDRREMIVLSQYHQMTPDAIAELLNVEVPEAKVRVHRAMMELRDLYRKLTG
jgi:RNA polymerase sigma factor (sigma-70 family)